MELKESKTVQNLLAAFAGTIVNYTVRNILLDWEAIKGATKYK